MSKLRPILGFASSPGGGIELEASWPAIWGQLERLATHHTSTYQQPPRTCLTILKVYHTKVILTQRKIRCRPICTKLFHSLSSPLLTGCRHCHLNVGLWKNFPDQHLLLIARATPVVFPMHSLASWNALSNNSFQLELSFWYSILYSWCRKTHSMDSMNRLILW